MVLARKQGGCAWAMASFKKMVPFVRHWHLLFSREYGNKPLGFHVNWRFECEPFLWMVSVLNVHTVYERFSTTLLRACVVVVVVVIYLPCFLHFFCLLALVALTLLLVHFTADLHCDARLCAWAQVPRECKCSLLEPSGGWWYCLWNKQGTLENVRNWQGWLESQ